MGGGELVRLRRDRHVHRGERHVDRACRVGHVEPTYSSAWIGVDGFNDNDLIQTGTEQDYYSGGAHYDAWWEILPAAETEIST